MPTNLFLKKGFFFSPPIRLNHLPSLPVLLLTRLLLNHLLCVSLALLFGLSVDADGADFSSPPLGTPTHGYQLAWQANHARGTRGDEAMPHGTTLWYAFAVLERSAC